MYLLPVAITLCIVSTATGLYISKTGRYRPPIYFGILFLILGHGLYINLPDHASWPRIIIFQIISGIGIGPLFQAPIIAVFSLTKPADIASAAGTVFFARDIAQAMSVVIGGVIFQNRMQVSNSLGLFLPFLDRSETFGLVCNEVCRSFYCLILPRIMTDASFHQAHAPQLKEVLPPEIALTLTDGDATAQTAFIQHLTGRPKRVVYIAYTESISTTWIFFTVLGVVALLLSLLISKQLLSREHKIGKTGLDVQEAARQEEAEAKK